MVAFADMIVMNGNPPGNSHYLRITRCHLPVMMRNGEFVPNERDF
jgi:hypothetical protein